MNITESFTARRVRAAIVTTVAAGAGIAGILGMSGNAQASTVGHRPPGWVVIDTCTNVSGKVAYTPGLRSTKLKSVHALLTGTTAGCSDIFSGAMSGTGTITATLSGNASVAAENFSGPFTINWPSSTGYNPSNGNLAVTDSSGVETVSGSVTSGFDTGTVLSWQYVITGHHGNGTRAHPMTSQTYTNSQPLNLSRNEG